MAFVRCYNNRTMPEPKKNKFLPLSVFLVFRRTPAAKTVSPHSPYTSLQFMARDQILITYYHKK